MSSFWIMDAKGRVLGPVGLQVIKDLAAGGRISGFTRASRDGKTWLTVADIPEVAAALMPPSVRERRQREQQEAQRIELQLDRYQELPPHELFGVPAGSPIKVYRQGFLALAKPYHPGRLSQDVDPALLKACMGMFQYLSTVMATLEQKEKERERARAPATAAQKPAPTYRLEDFVGLSRGKNERYEADIQVNEHSARMFVEHKFVNWSTGGFYLACGRSLPLGTGLDVTLKFNDPPTQVRVRGTVVLENVVNDPKQVSGFGVRLERLSDGDKSFLDSFVETVRAAKR